MPNLEQAREAGRAAFSREPYDRVIPPGVAYGPAQFRAVTEIVHAEFNPFPRGTALSNAFIDGWNDEAVAAALVA